MTPDLHKTVVAASDALWTGTRFPASMGTRTWLLVLLLAGFALAGCMGENEREDDPIGDPNNENEIPDPHTWNVTIQDSEFVNGSLTIQVGDTVRWVHEDGQTPHTVTSDNGTFSSGECILGGGVGVDCMTQGDTFEHTFEEAGEFPYHCQVHDAMTATITVQDASA